MDNVRCGRNDGGDMNVGDVIPWDLLITFGSGLIDVDLLLSLLVKVEEEENDTDSISEEKNEGLPLMNVVALVAQAISSDLPSIQLRSCVRL